LPISGFLLGPHETLAAPFYTHPYNALPFFECACSKVDLHNKDRKYLAFGKEKINSSKDSFGFVFLWVLEEQRWELAILVSQKLVRALPKPTWRVVLGEDQWRSFNMHKVNAPKRDSDRLRTGKKHLIRAKGERQIGHWGACL
jgi:hypothetical protein